MCNEITEDYLETLTTPKSFEKALDLFYTDAVFDTFSKGDILEGKCEGRGQPYYQVEVELENGLVSSAYCTCPYDWGGYCKHIIALLLTFIDDPTAFVVKVDLDSYLKVLDREELINLVKQIANHSRTVNDLVQKFLHETSTQQSGEKSGKITSKPNYKKRIQDIFNRLTRLRMSDAYWVMPEIIDELDHIKDTALVFYNTGDVQTALEIFTTLFLEVAEQYDQVDDSDGMLAYLFNDLAFYLSEVIIFADLDDSHRRELYNELQIHVKNLMSYGIDEVGIILSVLNKEWVDKPIDEWDSTDYQRNILKQVTLNVLERQGRLDEVLAYSLNVGAYVRHILMQIELGNIEDAVQTAWNSLSTPDDVLKIAETLKEVGYLDEAIRLAEKGLRMEGNHYVLGIWLAPLEEAQGRIDQAIVAYKAAFDSAPTFEIYGALKQLSGKNWEEIRHELIETMENRHKKGLLVDVYLSEGLWGPAISIADESGHWDYHLIDKVTKAVLPFRPEWVIKASQIQAERLILKASRNHYRIAVRWLEKAKKAYQKIDQQPEWILYLEGLKSTYSRRHALLEELSVLDNEY